MHTFDEMLQVSHEYDDTCTDMVYALEDLLCTVNLKCAFISGSSGKLLASSYKDDWSLESVPSAISTAIRQAQCILLETGNVSSQSVSISLVDYLIHSIKVSDQVVLTVVAERKVNSGFLVAELERAKHYLGNVIKSDSPGSYLNDDISTGDFYNKETLRLRQKESQILAALRLDPIREDNRKRFN